MKRLHTVLLISGVGFLVYLVWKVGCDELWQQLRALGWGLVPLLLSEGVANLAHTAGWRHCLWVQDRSVPLFRLFRMTMAGFAINYLTPSASVVGELTKVGLLASQRRTPEAVSSVLVDKFCLAAGHLLLVLAGSVILLMRVELPWGLRLAMILSTLLLGVGIFGFMLVQKRGKLGWLLRWLVAHGWGGNGLATAAQDVSEVDERLKMFYRERRQELLPSIGWHLFGHSIGVAQTWFFFRALNQPVSVTGIVGASILCLWFDLVSFAIPLGLGALEGGRIVAFRAIGSSALLGMTFGATLRLAQIFWACFGLLSYGSFIWARGPRNKASAPWFGRPAELRRQPEFEKPGSGR